MWLADAKTDFLLARDRSARTTDWYSDKLDRFFAWLPVVTVEAITPEHCRAFLAALKDRPGHTGKPLSGLTRHGYARTLRAFLYHCVSMGWYDARDVAWFKRGMPRREGRVIPVYTPGEVEALLRAAEQQARYALRARDKAVVLVLLDTGVRAGELCGLRLADTHPDRLTVTGKGLKTRVVGPLGRATQRALHAYLATHRHAAYGVDTTFVGDEGRPLDRGTLDGLLKRLRDRAGLTCRVSAHTFRHTYAVNYLLAGGDVYLLKELLGHSTVTTTEGYLRSIRAQQARGRSVADIFFAS